jgi:presenilin 1
MVVAALATVYINTEESQANGEAALSGTYNVYSTGNTSNSTSQQLGESLVNGLVIVSFICAMTFVIVLLYKYRWMKLLGGYMIFASFMLLGFLTSTMFQTAIDRYNLMVDVVTFYLFLYNFAVVGTAAIFFGKGFPVYITQAYLIATSVIVSWQLSHFDAWTAWVLLVLLALYDLFAVLTPCGPLKALVNLMQQEDAPEMPGLLYEASLPSAARRPNRTPAPATTTTPNTDPSSSSPSIMTDTSSSSNHDTNEPETTSSDDGTAGQSPETSPLVASISTTTDVELPHEERPQHASITSPRSSRITSPQDVENALLPENRTFVIPLALAKLYKLPLVDNPNPEWRRLPPLNTEEPPEPMEYTPTQLQTCVTAIFPPNGGRIEVYGEQQDENEPTRYLVVDREGNPKRILFCHAETGRVMEDLRENNAAAAAADRKAERNSIRLGLGDFIFYSILVSKAALYSFTTFAACTLAILTGLGLTLMLLAVYGHALPALPISIFLGVIFYLVTRYSVEPFVQDIFIQGCYV